MTRGGLVHHHHRCTAGNVALIEKPAAQQSCAHGLEISRSDLPEGDERIFAKTAADLPFKAKVTTPVAAGKRQKTDQAGSFDFRNGAHPLEQLTVELRLAFRLSVAARRQRQGKGHDPLRRKAEMDAQQMGKAFHQQAGTGDQN
jgi:hypothetical protein